ncbi:hypothetical protein [Kineococcus aurantiacus]|uniref:Uncharacterized protein n=1 Tax=Kineococcus aurantiacus TaxID=37633 RepID=A0A7Y9DRC3_9ACTN|nr:hypothetical protein [Kineococcus aurantiacus]NYD25051.1 hypothetical protein [Kineococcus aurantiacus]
MQSLTANSDDPDSFAAYSLAPSAEPEEKYLLRLLNGDDNSLSILSDRGTQEAITLGNRSSTQPCSLSPDG